MKGELTPQQVEFLRLYSDPKSETFGNARQSALKAGYSQDYSDTITAQMPEWFSVNLGKRKRLLDKAEKNLEGIMDKGVDDKDIIKVVADTSKFIASTVGKDQYSSKTEVEHSGGIKHEIDDDELNKAIETYARNRENANSTGDIQEGL